MGEGTQSPPPTKKKNRQIGTICWVWGGGVLGVWGRSPQVGEADVTEWRMNVVTGETSQKYPKNRPKYTKYRVNSLRICDLQVKWRFGGDTFKKRGLWAIFDNFNDLISRFFKKIIENLEQILIFLKKNQSILNL